MVKDIIWDFDGTLYDTYPRISDIFKEALQSLGIEAEKAEILPLLHKSFADVYEYYSKKYSVGPDTIGNQFRMAEAKMSVVDSPPFKDAEEILSLVIERGGSNFIYTNRSSSIYRFLEYHDFIKYFKEIITSDDGFGIKPSPKSINHLMEKYSLERDKVLMVGDRSVDIEAAVNADVKSCYFNTHRLPIDMDVDIYIESLLELKPYIGIAV